MITSFADTLVVALETREPDMTTAAPALRN
jgi:hypothetical protein